MRYIASTPFDRGVNKLSADRKERVKKSISMAVAFFETGDLPHGLGMKPLGHDLWEIRAGLRDRIVFHKESDVVKFLLVGTHDEIRQLVRDITFS